MEDDQTLESLAEDINFALQEIRELLLDCRSVGKGRPHEYEHNHFMLTQAIASYLILLEEYNGMDTNTQPVSS